jgi:glycosyltransferase involved in cell wall biosynthesis
MIDVMVGESQFVDHTAAIFLALPPEHRGDFIAHRSIAGRAREWGIPATGMVNDDRPVLVASYGDQKRARRMGRTRIARVEHGAGQSYWGDPKFAGNSSYSGGRGCGDVSLFLCPNDYSADRWQASYPGARVEVIGCAKLDSLPRRNVSDYPTSPVVCISFHFDINLIPETRWAWPAYKPVLPDLVKRYKVIGHGHPKGIGMLARYYARMGIEVVEDFADVCRRADLYVMDNSSTLFEFAATGRPVVPLNDPGFRRNVQHGGRFWNWSTVGLNVDRPAALVDTVERALADPPEVRAERERILKLVYPYRTGGAQRAADALVDWAGERQEAAA